MKPFAKGVVVFLSIILVMVMWDRWCIGSGNVRAQSIKVGDSKQQVERLLGHPANVFQPQPALQAQAATNWFAALLSVKAETWAYGSRFEVRHAFSSGFPYFWPIRLRLFTPDTDDVAVEFDGSGRVSRVTIPWAAE
jgi:hypothetical protein